MPGVTKHIFDSDIREILSMWNNQLKKIYPTLPRDYTKADIIKALKLYYPHEWNSVQAKYNYYSQKDKFISKKFGKKRYNMKRAELLLEDTNQYKIIISKSTRSSYYNSFSQEVVCSARKKLSSERKPRIEKINRKIDKAKSKVQQVTPKYIDQLIGLYERKNTSQKDKLYILAELKKYYSPEIVQFFFKLNDVELNKQLRKEAFVYLQNFNYHPRARKQKYMQVHSNSKKRKNYLKNIYPNEFSRIEETPDELEYRIQNSKEQKNKNYDFFISHSYKDSKIVQKLIEFENKQGNNVFCDWINDSDYLKRNLLCEATLNVIEMRLEQSSALIFVKSEFSTSSVWCKYELNYFYKLKKPIYYIDVANICNGNFSISPEKGKWFIDNNYKKAALFEGASVATD